MKLHVITVFCMMSAGSLMSMNLSTSMQKEEGKARLNFLVDSDQIIMLHSKENMEYFIEPKEFMGKRITEVVPLDEKDHRAIDLAFNRAAEEQETVKVPYTLDSTNFVAKITPLKRKYSVYDFFVKIKEAKK